MRPDVVSSAPPLSAVLAADSAETTGASYVMRRRAVPMAWATVSEADTVEMPTAVRHDSDVVVRHELVAHAPKGRLSCEACPPALGVKSAVPKLWPVKVTYIGIA